MLFDGDDPTGVLTDRREPLRRLVVRRLLKPWVMGTRAFGVLLTRFVQPGAEEGRLRAEVAAWEQTAAIERAHAENARAELQRVRQLAAARGLDLGGRPPAVEQAAERGATVLDLSDLIRRPQ